MGFLDGLLEGLEYAAGPAIGAGLGLATGNPFLGIAVGGSILGQKLTREGTSTQTIGATDEDIARAEMLARREGSAAIRSEQDRAGRMAAAQAAQGGTMESGLLSREFGDISGAAMRARGGLEADLARQRLSAISQRRYIPKLSGLGHLGRLISTSTSPLMIAGASQLMQGMWGAGAGLGGAQGGGIGLGRAGDLVGQTPGGFLDPYAGELSPGALAF